MKDRWGLLSQLMTLGTAGSDNIRDYRGRTAPIKRRGKVVFPDPRSFTDKVADTITMGNVYMDSVKPGPPKPVVKLKYKTGFEDNSIPHYVRTPRGPIRSWDSRVRRKNNIIIDVLVDQIVNKGKK